MVHCGKVGATLCQNLSGPSSFKAFQRIKSEKKHSRAPLEQPRVSTKRPDIRLEVRRPIEQHLRVAIIEQIPLRRDHVRDWMDVWIAGELGEGGEGAREGGVELRVGEGRRTIRM